MRPDQRLRELERGAVDPEVFLPALCARARLEGPGVFLEPLMSFTSWRGAHEGLQDVAAREVARRLDPRWRHLKARVFSCGIIAFREGHAGSGITEPWRDIGGGMMMRPNHLRVHVFKLEPLGMEFSLVPSITGARRPFLMARWPVLNRQFGSREGPELPAVRVSRREAREWCRARGLRLPSSDEWMFACMGGTDDLFYWGVGENHAHVWSALNAAPCPDRFECFRNDNLGPFPGGCYIHRPTPRPPREHDEAERWNVFGLVDMIGNVWEQVIHGKLGGSCEEDVPNGVMMTVGRNDHVTGFRALADIPGLV